MTQPCFYCGSPMPVPAGKKYTPCANPACGVSAITIYRAVKNGPPSYRFSWRKDAGKTAVIRVPVELAEFLKKAGNTQKAIDFLRGCSIIEL